MRSPAALSLATLALCSTAYALDSCPTTETIYTGPGGIRYRVCPDTDLRGESLKVTPNVASTTACAELCDKALSCFKAVYDTQGQYCHFKGYGGLDWEQDGRFDVIQVEQVNIARCPYPENKITNNGKTYKVCQDTDLRGNNAQVLWGVATLNDCVQRCATNDACTQAVYDGTSQACHFKGDPRSNTLIWSTDKRFDVIRLDVASNPAVNGAWSDLIQFPVIPVAAYVVPEYPSASRLLVWSSWRTDAFGGQEVSQTQFADYNFNTGAISQRTVANTQHDMFCPAISSLQDGRILISGGATAAVTSFYDPKTNSFTRGPDMKMPRGYEASVTLSDNRVFTIGGAWSGPTQGKDGEVYDPKTNSWTALPNAKVGPMLTNDAAGIWREDNHAWLFAWKNATVFQAGPSKAMNWYGTTGTGSQAPGGTRDDEGDAMCGVFAMYEPGKIFSAGGSQDYTDSDANNRAHITTIDTPNKPAQVERVADMAYPRGLANAVILPDGTILVSGGQRRSLVFTDTDGILYPELFNPVTKTWKTLDPQAVPRNYHSVSLLLADGRVFTGGGGMCWVGANPNDCNKLGTHPDGQVFSPPYLFNRDGSAATRPVISTLSTTTVKAGGRISIGMGSSASGLKFALVRMGSSTHSVNTDQRRVPLTQVTGNGRKYTVTLPGDSGNVPPGSYYLFVISGNGVPSIAKTVQVTL